MTVSCDALEREWEHRTTKLSKAKSCLTRTEEMWYAEKERLSQELEAKCRRVWDMGDAMEEARRGVAEDKRVLSDVERMRLELSGEADRALCDASAESKRLKREICVLDDELKRVEAIMVKKRSRNECARVEVDRLRASVQAGERLLAETMCSADALTQTNANVLDQLDRDNASLARLVRLLTEEIDALEQEVCRTRSDHRGSKQRKCQVGKPSEFKVCKPSECREREPIEVQENGCGEDKKSNDANDFVSSSGFCDVTGSLAIADGGENLNQSSAVGGAKNIEIDRLIEHANSLWDDGIRPNTAISYCA